MSSINIHLPCRKVKDEKDCITLVISSSDFHIYTSSYPMKLSTLITASLLTMSIGILLFKIIKRNKENMGGYGILSGLYYNNNAKRCFKNPYDPPDFPGYCETIGRVVV